MSEISKAVGQWIVGNVGWTVIIILFILSCIFKVAKKEIDPLGWVIGWFGKAFTKDVRKDVADLKDQTNKNFEKVKTDRAASIAELKKDYDEKIGALRSDLDDFEQKTNTSISEMQTGTHTNCEMLKTRLDLMEKSNDMQTVRQIKAHILDFANSCLNNRKHTRQEFNNIIAENESYEELCKKYELKNNVYAEDFKYIMKVYHDCLDKHNFLGDNAMRE